jgi:hypothetical protein
MITKSRGPQNQVRATLLCRGEIKAALLDQLGARVVPEPVPHHAYDLLLGKGLLLRPWGQRKGERRCQDEN